MIRLLPNLRLELNLVHFLSFFVINFLMSFKYKQNNIIGTNGRMNNIHIANNLKVR